VTGGKVFHDDDKKNDCFPSYRNYKRNIGDAFANGLLEEFKEFGGIGGHAFGRSSLGARMRSS